MINKHIKQYLDYTYPIGEDDYIHSDDIYSLDDIIDELIKFYSITEEESILYILGYYNYKFNLKDSDGYWQEWTYDNMGNQLTFKDFDGDSDGEWIERTYDSMGNELTFKDSDGYWDESTYDQNGNLLTYKDSYGYWRESTYGEDGNMLTCKNSDEDGYELTYKDGEAKKQKGAKLPWFHGGTGYKFHIQLPVHSK